MKKKFLRRLCICMATVMVMSTFPEASALAAQPQSTTEEPGNSEIQTVSPDPSDSESNVVTSTESEESQAIDSESAESETSEAETTVTETTGTEAVVPETEQAEAEEITAPTEEETKLSSVSENLKAAGGLATAATISTNTQYTGHLLSDADVNWYQFTISAPGYFTIQLSTDVNDLNAIGNGWNVALYKNITDSSAIHSLDAIRSNGTTVKFYCLPGTYYAKVSASHYNSQWHGPGICEYHLKINETPKLNCEAELNNTQDSATVITTNQAYTASLYDKDDTDWFSFHITKRGYFTVTLGSTASPDMIHSGWNMYVYQSGNSLPLRSYSNITAGQTSMPFPYEPGTYYVKVCSCSNYFDKDAPINADYMITVNENESSDWEVENNDTQGTANTIVTGTTHRGLLSHYKDVDWYTFQTTQSGYFNFILDTDAATSDVKEGFKVSVYRQGSTDAIKTITGIKSKTVSAAIPYPAGTYYVKVEAATTLIDTATPREIIYRLTVSESAAPNWESESNNTAATANHISAGSTWCGLLWQRTDSDFYTFSLDKSSIVTLYAGKDASTSDADLAKGWLITLYDKNQKKITAFTATAFSAYQKLMLDKGTYYVSVSSTQSYSDKNTPIDKIYNLKINFQSSVVTNVVASTSQATSIKLAWKKISYASGYEIYRSTSKNGTYSLVATINKGSTTSYTNKKLSCGKTYYYKIRSFITYNNKTTYAPYSSLVKKQAVPASVTICSVKSNRKAKETVTWKKVSGATGYIVYRSTGKNKAYKAIKTIPKGSTTSFTDSVKGGNTYYYKVKAYTTVSGKKIYGGYSSIKSAKAKK